MTTLDDLEAALKLHKERGDSRMSLPLHVVARFLADARNGVSKLEAEAIAFQNRRRDTLTINGSA